MIGTCVVCNGWFAVFAVRAFVFVRVVVGELLKVELPHEKFGEKSLVCKFSTSCDAKALREGAP